MPTDGLFVPKRVIQPRAYFRALERINSSDIFYL